MLKLNQEKNATIQFNLNSTSIKNNNPEDDLSMDESA